MKVVIRKDFFIVKVKKYTVNTKLAISHVLSSHGWTFSFEKYIWKACYKCLSIKNLCNQNIARFLRRPSHFWEKFLLLGRFLWNFVHICKIEYIKHFIYDNFSIFALDFFSFLFFEKKKQFFESLMLLQF